MRVLAAVLALAACGGYAHMPAKLGVTAGGAKDINFARQEIELGHVPPPSAFVVEGLLSQHDIPVDESVPCTAPICVRPALVEAQGALWLQLGMTSSREASQLKRPPLDLVVAIDKSSSMSVDMRETNDAVAALIRGLHQEDRVAIFAFDGSIHEVHPLGPIRDAGALSAKVHELRADGSWDIQTAIQHAFAVARGATGEGRTKRVAVLSCGYPSVSADGSDAFSKVIRTGADDGIGTTFVGVLLGPNPSLAKMLGDTHGGIFHFADQAAAIEKVFDTNLDLMSTPLAYDLKLRLDLASGYTVGEVYGLPGTGSTKSVALDIATVFYSRERGAIMVRLDRAAGAGPSPGKVHLAYHLAGGAGHDATVDLVPGKAAGARKGVALVTEATWMRRIAELAGSDRPAARALADKLVAYLAGEATALADEGLRREHALAVKLRANLGSEVAR